MRRVQACSPTPPPTYHALAQVPKLNLDDVFLEKEQVGARALATRAMCAMMAQGCSRRAGVCVLRRPSHHAWASSVLICCNSSKSSATLQLLFQPPLPTSCSGQCEWMSPRCSSVACSAPSCTTARFKTNSSSDAHDKRRLRWTSSCS